MATTLVSQHGDFVSHNCLTIVSLEYSEKHKTIVKYQQAIASSTHEKMGFEI